MRSRHSKPIVSKGLVLEKGTKFDLNQDFRSPLQYIIYPKSIG